MSTFPCPHEWEVRFCNVVGRYQKGEREVVLIDGDYEECSLCYEGQFVPQNPDLRTVPCEYINRFRLVSEPENKLKEK